MREIQVQKLTKDNFGKYGEFLDLLDESELKKKSIFQEGFFADVVALEFNQGNQPTISVCHVKKQSENIISFLEAHQYACEGLLPLDGDVIIFVGIMDSDFRTESIEAFYVPKGTFVKLNPLIVHGTQYPVDKEDVHIVCMLPGRTFKNDMLSRRLETGEQIRITIDNTNYYTKVEDAVRFVEQTGCDSLAIAVGNAHGPYVKTPNLDLERIYAIRKKVNIPLVLHGCSDIPEEQMKEAVNLGMSKFNIATEYFRTMYQSIEKRINNQEFEGNGVKLMYDIKEEMIDFVIQKIRLLNPNKYSM